MACVTKTSRNLKLILSGLVVRSIVFSALEIGPNKHPISGETLLYVGSLFSGFRGSEISYLVVEWTWDQYFQRTHVFEPDDANLGAKGRHRGVTWRHFR